MLGFFVHAAVHTDDINVINAIITAVKTIARRCRCTSSSIFICACCTFI